jgi:Flp pilus assembly protein TadD
VATPPFPDWLPPAALALVTLVLFWPALGCGFINYDDPAYVTANAQVQSGLTWASVQWAFCHPVVSNWHPLTMLSHILDCQLYGLKPAGHHLTSVLLHALNGALVFILLRQMTGAPWRSLCVAVLFAVHPLRVESVAWVAERKDVLSACFGLLALICYARYAGQAKIQNLKSRISYGLALLFFGLGLMSKAMLVTWPFVMLLLDYWPLGRFQSGRIWPLLREKMPFFALALAAGVVTFLVQQRTGAMTAAEGLPFGARGGNALISYWRYLGKMFWPANLAVFYPHLGYWPWPEVALAGGLVVGLSGFLFLHRERFPFLLIGWLWYCGTLVPVLGFVQVGDQAMADRYTYLPALGMLIFVVWGGDALARRWHFLLVPGAAAVVAAIVACLAMTRQQLGYWQDGATLFSHAVDVTQNNVFARNNLGTALNRQGDFEGAIRQFQEILRLKPDDVAAHDNLGNAFSKEGRIDDAIRQFQEALRLKPGDIAAHYNLGTVLYQQGDLDGALSQFQETIRLKPEDAPARFNLGSILAQKGRIDEAEVQFEEGIRLQPNLAIGHYYLGLALNQRSRTDEAIRQFQEALRLNPDFPPAAKSLARAMELKRASPGP